MTGRGRGARALAVLLLVAGLAEAGLRLAGRLYLDRLHGASGSPFRPGDVNVLCLGESSTIGIWVPREESYPGQLEARLRELYGNPRIRTIVPPHIGQNTSQVANRMEDYLGRYRPSLVIVMAGYNNEWSLAETHVGRFLPAGSPRTLELRTLALLDGLRLFRLFRYASLSVASRGQEDSARPGVDYALGHPELARYPPRAWVYDFAREHRPAFVAAWRDDVGQILDAAVRHGARGLLMTYHIDPTYLSVADFEARARDSGVRLVRNDEAFRPLIEAGSIGRYLMHDGWHPNRHGYALVARGALEAIAADDLLGLGRADARLLADRMTQGPEFPLWDDGTVVAPGTEAAGRFLGEGWSHAEGSFRWTEGRRAALLFRAPGPAGRVLRVGLRPFVAEGRLDRQRVELTLNGESLPAWEIASDAPAELAAGIRGGAWRADNVLTLGLPDAASPFSLGLDADRRQLGVAVAWMRLEPFPTYTPGQRASCCDARATTHLVYGWSVPEGAFRWTDGRRADIAFGLDRRDARVLSLELEPFLGTGLEVQRVNLVLNGRRLPSLELRDPRPRVHAMALPDGVLGTENVLSLELPDATAPVSLGKSADARRLGVALRWWGLGRAALPEARR